MELTKYKEQFGKLFRTQRNNNWALGDLAIRLEAEYGTGELRKIAEENGADKSSVFAYIRVAKAYPKADRSPVLSWSVHETFASQPDCIELVKQDWTLESAREEVSLRRATKDKNPVRAARRVQEIADRVNTRSIRNIDKAGKELDKAVEKMEELGMEPGPDVRESQRRLHERQAQAQSQSAPVFEQPQQTRKRVAARLDTEWKRPVSNPESHAVHIHLREMEAIAARILGNEGTIAAINEDEISNILPRIARHVQAIINKAIRAQYEAKQDRQDNSA